MNSSKIYDTDYLHVKVVKLAVPVLAGLAAAYFVKITFAKAAVVYTAKAAVAAGAWAVSIPVFAAVAYATKTVFYNTIGDEKATPTDNFARVALPVIAAVVTFLFAPAKLFAFTAKPLVARVVASAAAAGVVWAAVRWFFSKPNDKDKPADEKDSKQKDKPVDEKPLVNNPPKLEGSSSSSSTATNNGNNQPSKDKVSLIETPEQKAARLLAEKKAPLIADAATKKQLRVNAEAAVTENNQAITRLKLGGTAKQVVDELNQRNANVNTLAQAVANALAAEQAANKAVDACV